MSIHLIAFVSSYCHCHADNFKILSHEHMQMIFVDEYDTMTEIIHNFET